MTPSALQLTSRIAGGNEDDVLCAVDNLDSGFYGS